MRSRLQINSWWKICTVLSLVVSLLGQSRITAQGDQLTLGAAIYKKQCIRCHGQQGEGVKDKYASPLEGDKSINQLALQIKETMPENAPDSLTKQESEAVAKYVHESFYSKIARERNKPVRADLSRLTVRQYRLAVADVIDHKLGKGWWGEKRGLKGDYFNFKHWHNDKKVLERVDPAIEFDFGTGSPVKGKMEDYEFYIHWFGGVLATETGWHDFIIKSNQACRLHVNHENKPIIDAWVKSGKDDEFKASLYLIAGKVYPIKLEFSKAKQGVDDSADKKKAASPVPSYITLKWKPPGGVVQTIPAQNLTPDWFPESYAATTPFPPDDRSYGWERGSSISKAWDQASTDAALEATSYVVERIDKLAGIKSNDKERDKKIKQYCQSFIERAYRRPLSEEQKSQLEKAFSKASNYEDALKRIVLTTLKSPRFLYRDLDDKQEQYAVASRLSFALWDALPDEELLKAAAAGKLKTREQIDQQAWRMLNDQRAVAKLNEFFRQWLKIDQVHDLSKDAKRYPGFSDLLIQDLRSSLNLFLNDVAWSKDSQFKALLLSEEIYLNEKLAKFYEVKQKVEGFQKVKMDVGHRAGVLTHPYLMSSFAYVGETSPIHRGVFLARGILGITLKPPMEAFTPLPAELHPTLSTRERVSLQTKQQACMSCHTVINPLGFTMEHFDAVGRFREKDNGKPIDATGAYFTRTGKLVKFAGVRDLAQYLADSPEVHEAFTEQLFQHMVKQPIRAYGVNKRTELTAAFTQSNFHIKNLMVQIAVNAALPSQGATAQSSR